ncbi:MULTISPECIES: BREX-1 system adenine-specific DNA-methyltransferase PglX [Lachnospiraceae]|jgi:type II restriction/modification system DNA methylase subunit YeeA|uniref:BREX-1 system adenine-specific DNA-methyltransferase PglX n=1 Tax=Lachnospiraceae TaxID=186803 RepID=UPI000E47BF80|nr:MULTISPECIES: BREX-1 system adenine-specific DNA-methyltransferase PglX [Lachnospiraceae]RHR22188.1 BREX-1 system adenine-specific DNA-methyltransferase PglX [Blautia sp. AF19-13LB]RHR47321.1 BREX-1 system adenine-specific DNA-methyltransferase PglX [Blautia sp. AF17-9LB]RHS91601.1 BREX-1 system adenine-specific DNA-methyltransferase PglX [Blautia sp. AM42-2]RHU14680.1 BREX-1 system adenine-specific DNA-methyltransferase PglX [Blautia sp. TM10-2]RHV78660.1 BREX-1 system adenine-specific DNA
MDKNAIKKFAVWARTELIARVSLKGVEYGITEDNIEAANADSVGGKVLTADEKKQRQALIAEINDKGYKQVMEEVAYTWFNRFSALRFMEVNGYIPSHVRVFTDEENNFKPQIITEAIHLDLDGLDMEKVYELKDAEKTEELYKYLLIVQCNALNKILPGMFQKIADYTELLLPDNLLREGSVIQQMIELIPEDDWKDAVQIIGWLYQYYNSEKKDDVFAALKKNVKITKENIPAATQLFTPDWIVRYMVENSLGRLWLEGHPDVKEQLLPTEEEQSAYAAGNRDPEDTKWHYYLEEAEQEPEVQAQLAEIRKEYAALTPDQLKVIDPCSGSGHILAYMFDVLMKIYESYGYTTREAVASIVENNIYGLDIDDRATQLAYFAVMMKARQYDRRFFSRGIQPHVYAIVESNHVDEFAVDYFCNGDAKLTTAMDTIIKELHDAKEYGSILTVTPQDWSTLYDRFAEITEDINMSRETALRELLPLVQVAEALAQKYDVVVTNPPYMGSSGMSIKLSDYVKSDYPDSKSDLFAVFIERCGQMTKKNGCQAMITQHAWMFLASYENIRKKISKKAIINMAHLGARAFEEIGGEIVQTTSFVIGNTFLNNYLGTYCRLVDPTTQTGKEELFIKGKERYISNQLRFQKIPGEPIAYWISEQFANCYDNELLEKVAFSDGQILTGNNDKYLKLLWEVNAHDIEARKWALHAKGGEFRRWYGNIDTVVKFDPITIQHYKRDKIARFPKDEILFRRGITWTLVSMNPLFGVRELGKNLTFNKAAATILFNDETIIDYVLGFLNSKVSQALLRIINPTMNNNIKDILNMPFIKDMNFYPQVKSLVQYNISISKQDWDAFETSWDFQKHPLLRKVSTIAEAFDQWQTECNDRFNQLKANEEKLNRIFIDIYGLQDELTPEVEDKDVTVRKADLGRDIRSFISYAVGCMFGRHSLDADGLVYAGGEWDNSKYSSFAADKDNIIPICDDEYFEDDIVGLFVEFVKTVYGVDTLDENLKFIADALGGKGQPKDVIRNYFLNDFYKDHCKIYQKRPIYWLFDSGKKNGFKALIYMHRYQPDTIARIRTDYVHEQQARYRTAIADLEQRMVNASTGERVKLNKKLNTLQAQDTEIRIYEEKIHHLADQMISIDLDDGVKKNYAIFDTVLKKL